MEWFLNLLHLRGSLKLFAVWGKFLVEISIFKMRHLIEKNCKIKWKSDHFGVLKMTINDQIWLFSDFDSFEKLNLLSKLLKWSCWFQCVWIWNLLLSLLWLKCKYCITTQKTVCLTILGKIIDVDWHKTVCFYATIEEIARSWSYGSFFWFISVLFWPNIS